MAKDVFQVHCVSPTGRKHINEKIKRVKLIFFETLPRYVVGMEACGSSRYWGRTLREFGHDVRLMPAAYVKPYVKSGKTDAADAEAICEAVRRTTMRLPPIALDPVKQNFPHSKLSMIAKYSSDQAAVYHMMIASKC